MAPTISLVSLGSITIAASPATSGILDVLDVMTGTPEENASKIGIPNPSNVDI